jgi:hypothetical protein
VQCGGHGGKHRAGRGAALKGLLYNIFTRVFAIQIRLQRKEERRPQDSSRGNQWMILAQVASAYMAKEALSNFFSVALHCF